MRCAAAKLKLEVIAGPRGTAVNNAMLTAGHKQGLTSGGPRGKKYALQIVGLDNLSFPDLQAALARSSARWSTHKGLAGGGVQG